MLHPFNFEQDKNFFIQSNTINELIDKVQSELIKLDRHTVSIGVQLFAESVIKHNLDINMMAVDHYHLLSQQNSEKIQESLGQILFKEKHQRTDKDFQLLREVNMVKNVIDSLSFSEDFYDKIKCEYIEYKKIPSTQLRVK